MNPIDKLLISPPAQPDDHAWSAYAHAHDDLVRRAAYHGLMGDKRQRQMCIDGAKKLAEVWGPGYSSEQHVRIWEEATEREMSESLGEAFLRATARALTASGSGPLLRVVQ